MSGLLGLGVDRLLRRRLAAAAADLIVLRLRSADIDLLRLHRLGDLTLELDREQTVLDVRATDLDMVGQREAPLERAGRNPAIDVVVALLFGFVLLAAGNDQHVLLGRDVELVGLEPRDRQLDSIIIIAELDQVERRIILLALPERVVLEHVEQPVEADGGAPERRKIESTTHGMSSI